MKVPDVRSYGIALSQLKTLYSYSAGENAEIPKKTIERIRSSYLYRNLIEFFSSK